MRDEMLIVGNTIADCAANVLTSMKRLNQFQFRVNFAKCQFTPSSSIDFLGVHL
jgi:hypothetical protein